MDLGTERKKPETMPSSPDMPDGPAYPSFTLNDAKAEEFLENHPVKLGDTIMAHMKLKVSALRADQFGKSVGFDACHMDVHKHRKSDGDDDNDAVSSMMEE